MKICLINNLYPPLTVGGAERIVELIAKGLVKTEHQVVVITTCLETEKNIIANGSFKLYRLNPGNIYHYCQSSGMPVFKKLIWHFIDIFGCKACRKVKQVLKKEQPDVVFTHNLKGFSYKIPKLISKLKIKS